MANMFGAINRFISSLDLDQSHKSDSNGSYGFQVLKNQNPDLAIEPWFDFIIGINGRTIDNSDPSLFSAEVKNRAGGSISLGIYSAKGQNIREQYVQIPAGSQSLGLSLQWSPTSIAEDVWHILDVTHNSPAETAGLLPYGDYVIGYSDGTIQGGENALPILIQDYINRELVLFVYNHEYDVTRQVSLIPTTSWGGEGALGCILGYGALHRIPAPLTEPIEAPGEMLFEAAHPDHESSQSQSATPAPPSSSGIGNISGSMDTVDATTASGPPRGARKSRVQPNQASGQAMEDYFKEGEEQSRAVDGGSSTPKVNSTLPPPPKAGSPNDISNVETPEAITTDAINA